VFLLIYEGHIRIKNNGKDYSCVIEEEITHDLSDGVENFLESDKAPAWVQKFSIQCERPISPHGKVGRSMPRLDIRIRSGEAPFPKFVFEAKRLRHNTRPADYFGSDGIERFWNGTGYPVNLFNEAGMIGYVQNRDTVHWNNWLKERFEKRRDALHASKGSDWESAIQVTELSDTFCTRHQPDANEEPIVIFHLLLLFC